MSPILRSRFKRALPWCRVGTALFGERLDFHHESNVTLMIILSRLYWFLSWAIITAIIAVIVLMG